MIFKKHIFSFCSLILVILADAAKNSEEANKPDIARVAGKTRRSKMEDKTSVGTLSNVISQIQNLPNMDLGKRFRSPCKTGNRCGKSSIVGQGHWNTYLFDPYVIVTRAKKVIRRLMVPKLAQLENTIMGIMKELSKMPPGARLPDKFTKTEPMKLLLDQNYKEEVCNDKLETCLKEDKRRKRILKKLFFKKYNGMRQELIGYGGRRLWGGEGNLFYRK